MCEFHLIDSPDARAAAMDRVIKREKSIFPTYARSPSPNKNTKNKNIRTKIINTMYIAIDTVIKENIHHHNEEDTQTQRQKYIQIPPHNQITTKPNNKQSKSQQSERTNTKHQQRAQNPISTNITVTTLKKSRNGANKRGEKSNIRTREWNNKHNINITMTKPMIKEITKQKTHSKSRNMTVHTNTNEQDI